MSPNNLTWQDARSIVLALLPLSLWLMLFLSLQSGDVRNITHFGLDFTFLQGLRSTLPLIAAFIAVIIIAFTVFRTRSGKAIFLGPLGLAAVYGLVGVIASTLSPKGLESLYWSASYLSIPLVLWAIVWGPNSLDRIRGLIALNWLILIIALASLFAFALIELNLGSFIFSPDNWIDCKPQAWLDRSSNFIRSTGVGRYAALTGIISLSRLWHPRWRSLWSLVFLASMILLLYSGARTSFVGFAVAAPVIVLLSGGRRAALGFLIMGVALTPVFWTTGIHNDFLDNCIFRRVSTGSNSSFAATPAPAELSSADPILKVTPVPTEPSPADPKLQATSAPTEPDSPVPKLQATPAPTEPSPADPKLQATPAPTEPSPADPKLQATPAPTESSPADPKLQAMPAPTEPDSPVPKLQATPAPTESRPADPKLQATPAPTESRPADPKLQAMPAPTEPGHGLNDSDSVGIPLIGVIPENFLNFSGRTRVWRQSLGLVGKSPLLGYGFQADRYLLGTHAHNSLVQSLLQTGVVGTIPFVAGVLLAWALLLRTGLNLVRLSQDHRLLFIQVAGVLTFFSIRTITESTGAFFGVDWLLLGPILLYLQLVNSRSERTALTSQ